MAAAAAPAPAAADGVPDLSATLQTLSELYHGRDPSLQAAASLRLQALQESVHAWKISDELLHRKVDVESCCFAAQTMRNKVQKSFSELPPEAHESLRDSLLEHVQNLDEGSHSVLATQLSVAAADLALQMTAWRGFVADLVRRLGPTRPYILLEILSVLPEEVNSRHLRLGSERREQVIQVRRYSLISLLALLCFEFDYCTNRKSYYIHICGGSPNATHHL